MAEHRHVADCGERVLLTVPQLEATSSPYRELMALCKGLTRRGFRLDVCSLRPNGSDITGSQLAAMGVGWFVARFRPAEYGLSGWLEFLKYRRVIRGRGRYAIHHSLDFTSMPLEAWSSPSFADHFLFTQRSMNRNGYRWALKARARRAGVVVGISEGVCGYLRSLQVAPSKIRRVYNGFHLSVPQGVKAAVPGILCVAHLQRGKRQIDLIRAVARVRERQSDIMLRLVGEAYDTEYEHQLRLECRRLSLEKHVQFLGRRTDVPALLAQSSILVSCSETEALGTSIIEAMKVGVPVVSSRAEGPSEFLVHQENAWLVDTGDVAGFAEGILNLLENETLRQRLVDRARATAERLFSPEPMVEAYAAIYRELLARGCASDRKCQTLRGAS
ncbi:MAG: glycosyltransferase family 4 protein [Verrucomicrobiae bacterium]|nr:glycosyltransferase family 4 protein [Verrucomicrobiae bacterium]